MKIISSFTIFIHKFLGILGYKIIPINNDKPDHLTISMSRYDVL